MAGRKIRSIAMATAIAMLAGSIGSLWPAARSYAEEGHGAVQVEINDSTVTIGNDAITRTFSTADDKLRTTKIDNTLGDSTFTPKEGSEEFVISGLAEAPTKQTPENGQLHGLDRTGWSMDGTSVATNEGGGYAALIDTNMDSYYHSNYGQGGNGTDKQMPIDLILDRGENYQNESFQTLGYRPRKGGVNSNGNIQKYEIYVSDNRDTLFTDANNKKKTGTFQYNGIYPDNNNPEFIYTSLPAEQTGRYVGLRAITAANGNYVAGIEIGLFREAFDSFPEVVSPVLKSSDLTLENVTQSPTEVEINGEDKVGKIVSFEFAQTDFGTGKADITQKVVMYDGDPFMRKFLEIKLSDENARISYIDGEHLMTDSGDKTWTIPTDNGGIVEMVMERAILGQPIYINGMFLGSEFPAADSQIVDDLGRLRYWTGKNFADFTRDGQLTTDGKYVSWQTVLGASRTDGSDQNVLQADFFDYIYSIATPSEFRIQYNSWYDNMMFIDEQNIYDAFAGIDKNFSKTGVRPLDSYVVDDGWILYRQTPGSLSDATAIRRIGPANEVNTSGFWAFNSKFPNELDSSSELVQNFGSNFGVWVGPRGGYNYFGDLANIIRDAGNGSKSGGSIDVADDRYVKKLTEMFIDFMTKWQVNYWKWDGFADNRQYDHFPKGEGVVGYSEDNHHMYGGPNGYYHATDLWEKWIVLMKNVREAEKELGINKLWISLTCYTNPSPWFLQWANSVWLQCNADRGENWNSVLNNKMDNMLTYRDAAYHYFIKKHQFQFPLANVYNHDPIYGKQDTGIQANSMNGEQFRNYMFMQATRGTAFWELYYSDSIFNEEKYLINADFLEWVEENFDMLRNAKMIGATPSSVVTLQGGHMNAVTGEQNAYGFACFDGTEGIVSMRNPDDAAQTIEYTLNEAIGVNEAGTYHVVVEHSYTNNNEAGTPVQKESYNKGEKVTMTLKPGETQIWRFTQNKETEAPVLDKFYVKDSSKVQVRASERLYADSISFTVKVNGNPVEATKTAYADLRSFDLTLATPLQDGDKVEVTATGATDRAKNALNSTIEGTYYLNNLIASKGQVSGSNVVISDADRSMEGDNGFTVSAKVKTGDKNKVLVSQGSDYKLGIDAEGKPYFTFNGTTATAPDAVTADAEVILAGVKENNGIIKIYVDGDIKKAAYEEKNKTHEVTAADIVANGVNGVLEDVKVFSQSLGYDEVPSTALAELVAKAEAEKNNYTSESWTAAGMESKLTAAKAAITAGEKAAMDEQYEILYAAYKTLVPNTRVNLALNKNVDAGWVDPNENTSQTNSASPFSKAVDGVLNNAGQHAIFGKDNIDKPSYITVDLGKEYLIDSVKLYRYWEGTRTYKSTAIVISKDADFTEKEVLYYSGSEDVMNLGQAPSDELYVESANGKELYSGEAKEARYVRLYANGVESGGTSKENHIVELQVFGREKDSNPYDVSSLEALIAQAQTEEAKTDVYTADSIAALTEAREQAETVVAEVTAGTQADKSLGYILNAEDALKAALAALETIGGVEPPAPAADADYAAVDAAIARAEALNAEDYKDFSAVTAAIEAVERGLTEEDQARVDAMAKAINDAIDALEKKETQKEDKPWIFTDMDKDVANNTWKYKAVLYVYNTGDPYLMGPVTGTTHFQPDRPLERGMLATVLYRWAGVKGVTAANPFSDVKAGKYYHDPIVWAAGMKIVSGDTGSTTFRPEDHVRRCEIAKMLYEYGAKHLKMTMEEIGDLNQFTDTKSVPGWAVPYMKWATGNGIITGKPNADGTSRMDPMEKATRAECAAMIQRFADKYLK